MIIKWNSSGKSQLLLKLFN